MRTLATFAVIATFSSACVNSSYTVPDNQRLAYMSLESGSPTVGRCGERYKLGLFYGGLTQALPEGVEGHASARKAKGAASGAFGASMVSLGMSVAAVVLVATADWDQPGVDVPDEAWAGLGLAAGALIPATIGAVLGLNAQAHGFDALNRYNDSVANETDANVCGR